MLDQITTSEAINEIFPAFVAAQAMIKPVPLNKVNPHFKSKYADLSSIKEGIREGLIANSLAVIQSPNTDNTGNLLLTTLIIHKSGQWLKSLLTLKIGRSDNAQAVGSAITYARRYALASMLGVVSDDDDDGNAVVAATSSPTSTQTTTNRHSKPEIEKKHTPNKIIFNKDSKNFVAKIDQQVAKTYGKDAVVWICEHLHNKEVKAGIIDEYIEKWIEHQNQKIDEVPF